jgi:hypothetical protein
MWSKCSFPGALFNRRRRISISDICSHEHITPCSGRANGYWRFFLSHGRANRNWLAVLHFLSISYTIRNYTSWFLWLSPAFNMVSFLAYFSNQNMEVICSPEKSINFRWNIWRYIGEDITLYRHLIVLFGLWIDPSERSTLRSSPNIYHLSGNEKNFCFQRIRLFRAGLLCKYF